jgi:hypothetical protein
MNEEVFCRICGISNKEGGNFYYNSKHGKNICAKHYVQLERYGEILNRTRFDENEYIIYNDYAEIICYNKNQKESVRLLIDLEDVDKCKTLKWKFYNGYGYSKSIKIHRYLLNIQDEDIKIDHINRNKLDNRKENLRVCSQMQNLWNSSKRSDNTSGVIGVSENKKNKINPWNAELNCKNKKVLRISVKTKQEAIILRLKAELKYFGEFAPQKHLFKEYGIENEIYISNEDLCIEEVGIN